MLNAGFWPWLFLGAIAVATYDSGPNLSGLWVRDNGSVIRLSQDGQDIRGIHVQPSESLVEYGFSVGDWHLTGTLDGRRLRGDISMHFPLSMKSVCGDQWAKVVEIELTLSEDNNTLQGRRKNEEANTETCAFIRETWVSVRYVRSQ